MKLTDYKLENNFKVIYAKDTSNPLVCLQLYIKTGSAKENEKEAGFSHLIEHLVFKSTAKYPENSIMEQVTYLGGQINAYTEYDSTCFYLILASEFTREGLEILAQLACHANFYKDDFRSEKKVIIEELKQYENEPEDLFLEKIASTYLTKHPYKNPIIGNRASINEAELKDIVAFYQTHYVPANAFLVVCGNFQESELFSFVEQAFGSWKDKPVKAVVINDEPFPEKPAFFQFANSLRNDMIAFAFPDLKESHADSYALSFGVKQFAIGKNSRLYRRLFLEEKLIDSVRVHSVCGKYNGFSIFLIYPKSKADLNTIIRITLDEWNNLLQYGLSENEITEQKKEYSFHYRYVYEYIESLASSLGNEELAVNYENFLAYPRRINSLSKQQIDSALQKYLNLKHVYLFYYGNRQKIDSFPREIPPLQNALQTPKTNVLEKTLANGMKIIFKKVVGKPTVGIATTCQVSQLHEQNKQRGINLITATLLLYGNKKRDYEQFMRFCNSQGISFGVAPEIETTTIKMKCFKESVMSSLELLSDVLNQPLFPIEHFQNIRQTISSNIDRIPDYPQYYSHYLWKKMFFGAGSSYINSEGTKTSLHNLTIKQIKQWHQTNYRPENLTVAVVGDFHFGQVLQKLELLFPASTKLIPSLPMQNIQVIPTIHYRRTNKNLSQSHIRLGGLGCSMPETKKHTAFHVLANLIGGDVNSILFSELREKTGFAYTAEFDFRSTQSMGIFQASTIVDKSNEKRALSLIKKVLAHIKINGISSYELEKTINYIRGNRLLEEESVLSQASTMAKLLALGFDYSYYLQRDNRLKNVNLQMLKSIAEEYFQDDNFFVHILG